MDLAAKIRAIRQKKTTTFHSHVALWWMRSIQFEWLCSLYTSSYRLNLAIACNYDSIYCCEHCAKNGLISLSWSIAPDTVHLTLISRRDTAFIMLLTVLSRIDAEAGKAPQALGRNECLVCTAAHLCNSFFSHGHERTIWRTICLKGFNLNPGTFGSQAWALCTRRIIVHPLPANLFGFDVNFPWTLANVTKQRKLNISKWF